MFHRHQRRDEIRSVANLDEQNNQKLNERLQKFMYPCTSLFSNFGNRYDFDDVPNANFQVLNYPRGVNYARYCRDSLSLILKECPEISGVTLRVHVECGIPEKSYSFWKIYFEAIKNCGRKINLDLHAKGIDDKLINIALKYSKSLSISPKYISEHMGLPYHQASIRKQEFPPRRTVNKKWTFSIEEQYRLKDSLTSFDRLLIEIDVNYNLLKQFELGFGSRYLWLNDDIGAQKGFEHHVRFHLYISHKTRIGRLSLRNRFKYQQQNEIGKSRLHGDYTSRNYRWKSLYA